MANNPYFNFFHQANEQNLMDDLVVESNKQFAHNMVYLPRIITQNDNIMNEPVIQEFTEALDIELYIKNWDSFEGQGQLMAKFGLEIRDQMTMVMTKRSFNQFIQPISGKSRPWEGDCIFIPMLGVVYQVKYAESSAQFYALGKNYSWEVVCELLEFNNEQFKTGRPEIDDLNPAFQHYDEPDYDLESYDRTAKNAEIQEESDDILDWSENNPFGRV